MKVSFDSCQHRLHIILGVSIYYTLPCFRCLQDPKFVSHQTLSLILGGNGRGGALSNRFNWKDTGIFNLLWTIFMLSLSSFRFQVDTSSLSLPHYRFQCVASKLSLPTSSLSCDCFQVVAFELLFLNQKWQPCRQG